MSPFNLFCYAFVKVDNAFLIACLSHTELVCRHVIAHAVFLAPIFAEISLAIVDINPGAVVKVRIHADGEDVFVAKVASRGMHLCPKSLEILSLARVGRVSGRET